VPSYSYQCEMCGDIAEREHTIGTAPRTRPCGACGGRARLRIGVGVHVAPSGLEHKGAAVRAIDAKEAGWHRDMPAYKRMRDRGMQPAAIDGAALVEDRVRDQLDITYAPLIEQGIGRDRIVEGVQAAADIVEGFA
jgi:predicted nucleic acid-binding Zn ribbon protein